MAAQLATATAKFDGLDGQPARPTLIIALEDPPLPVGAGEYVVNPSPLVVQAAVDGTLSVQLPRGAKVRVAIEGTTYVRTITVPNVASFDLLQAMGDVPDQFAVQATPPLVSRRSF